MTRQSASDYSNGLHESSLRAMIARLERLIDRLGDANSKERPPIITAIDPTTNVKEALAAAVSRIDDIRRVDKDHERELRDANERADTQLADLRRRLSEAETKRLDAVGLAERNRVDSVFAETKSALALTTARAELTASALAERVDTTAKALAQSVTESVQSANERMTRLEQAQYLGGGREEQRKESRGNTNWTVGLLVSVGLGVAGMFLGAAYFAVNLLTR